MLFQQKLEALEEENMHPSDVFIAKMMVMVQNYLVEKRDNERFEDWSYDKIIRKCNLHGEYYTQEEQNKRLRGINKERKERELFFNRLNLGVK